VKIEGVTIEDTFAEAFTMRVARLIITGRNAKWAREAAVKLTGFATSVIGCKCEAGIERELTGDETPDGRPGVSVLFLTLDKESLPEQLIVRIGQTVLTCPTTACFDGLALAPDRLAVGKALRVFGDGFQTSKVIGGKRYWRLPVMEGEFLVEETFGMHITVHLFDAEGTLLWESLSNGDQELPRGRSDDGEGAEVGAGQRRGAARSTTNSSVR